MQTSQAVRTDQRTDFGAERSQSGATALREVTRTHKRDYSVRPKGGFKPEKRDRQGSLRSPKQQPSGTWSTAQGNCSRCGKQHGKSDICEARRADCFKCGKRGHYAVMCRTLQLSDVFTKKDEPERFFLGAITVKDTNTPWPVTLQLQDSDGEFKIDSGADTTVISQHTYDTLKTKPKLEHSQAVLDCPGSRLKNQGKFRTSTNRKGRKYCLDVHVVEGPAVNNLLNLQV